MGRSLTLPLPGTLGNIAGVGSDGVLLGAIAWANPTKSLLKQVAAALPLCITDDGGLYVDETTPFREATADDVEVVPATPAADDACYFGLAAGTFARIDLNITTAAVDLVATIVWEYWNGTAWTAVSGLTDGTTGLTAATGIKTVSFTLPTDWAKCTVDSVNAYWVRVRVSAYTSITTAPQIGQGWIVPSTAQWTDDTTDMTDAGTGDVALLPTYPLVGDGMYFGYGEKFCKLKVTTSQARTGTATLALKYWNGSSWAAVTTVEDDSTGWSESAGTLLVHFVPPSDWVANSAANGPNGETGYFVVMELTVLTSVTQQPLATQGWVLPLATGGAGVPVQGPTTITEVSANAFVTSGSTADSVFLLVNVTRGTFETLTWTKTDAFDVFTTSLYCADGDELAVVQITEDGTTEFGSASLFLSMT